jgi:hypothetical protein
VVKRRCVGVSRKDVHAEARSLISGTSDKCLQVANNLPFVVNPNITSWDKVNNLTNRGGRAGAHGRPQRQLQSRDIESKISQAGWEIDCH